MNIKLLGIAFACVSVIGGGYLFAKMNDTSSSKPMTVAQKGGQSLKVRTVKWEDLLPDGTSTMIPLDAASDFPDVMASPSPSMGMGSEMGGDMNDLMGGVTGAGKDFMLAENAPRDDMDGQRIALAGYMTPIAVENNKTRTFLLVPYVGACIHVPAPPPNQVVLVEAREPVEVREMWTPFVAVGKMSVETVDTGLAEVGYTMELERIEKYEATQEG